MYLGHEADLTRTGPERGGGSGNGRGGVAISMLTAEPGLSNSDFSPNVAVELAALSMAPQFGSEDTSRLRLITYD